MSKDTNKDMIYIFKNEYGLREQSETLLSAGAGVQEAEPPEN